MALILDIVLITLTFINAVSPVAAFGFGLHVRISLGGAGTLSSLSRPFTPKFSKFFSAKPKKHHFFKLLAQNKLDSKTDIVSQAMQNEDISPDEFHRALQEVQKCRKHKVNIRNQAKTKVKQIIKEQREELLEQLRKEGKATFLQKILNTSGNQGVNSYLKYKAPPLYSNWLYGL